MTDVKITKAHNYIGGYKAEGPKGITFGLTEDEARANYEQMA